MQPLNASEKRSLQEAAARYHAALPQVMGYLQGRGIDLDTAKRFGLGYVADPITGDERYAGRLAIPSLGFQSIPYAMRFRSIDGSDPKYLGKHTGTRLFNIRALHEADDEIHITEGEIDAITLEMCGLHAVGVTGANAWKRHHPRLFVGFQRVFVWGDNDDAGRQFMQKVMDSVLSARAVRMRVEHDDVNAVYVRDGKDGVLNLMESQ